MTRRLTTIALLLTLWTPPWSYAGEPPFTVLAPNETIHLDRLCSRDGPGKVREGWLPTPEQILQAETLLPKFVRANGRPKGPLNYYYRQYLGVVIGDKRLIYVNVFPRWLIEREELSGISPSNWRTAFINICDGGDGFWGALYDPKTLRFSSPRFNGEANKALERAGANRQRHDERACAGRSAPSRWSAMATPGSLLTGENTMRRSMIGLSSTCLLAIVLSGGVAPATYAADESVTVVARLYASPGREAELEARVLKTVEFVRKAEPNITYRAHRSKKDPSLFLFYEVYPSQAAFDKHAKETIPAFRKEFGPPAEGLFARPPEIEFFRAVAD